MLPFVDWSPRKAASARAHLHMLGSFPFLERSAGLPIAFACQFLPELGTPKMPPVASASPSWGRFLGQRIAGRQTERAHFATIAKPLGAAFARLIACAPALVAED